MNDTVISEKQVEILKKIMDQGMMAVYLTDDVSKTELQDLCHRLGFNYEKWTELNNIGIENTY